MNKPTELVIAMSGALSADTREKQKDAAAKIDNLLSHIIWDHSFDKRDDDRDSLITSLRTRSYD